MRTRRPTPYMLSIRDIAHRSGEMREHDLTVTPNERWGAGLVSVDTGQDVEMQVRLESVHEGILATANIATVYEGVCGRCLIEIARPVQVEIQELFAYPGQETSDFEVQDDHVDLETPVRDAIVLSLPFQPVCQPDCPGLDPVTGERLSESAGTQARVPIDPRWAALQEFTDQGFGMSRRGASNTEES